MEGTGEDLIAHYGGGTWDAQKGYTPNWTEQDRLALIDRYGEEEAVVRWMQRQDDIMEGEAELRADAVPVVFQNRI
eukprot:COSAG01_NODE_15620_length_1318_cov_10.278097_1_plen_76_part_00